MMFDTKDKQINLRVSKKERDAIRNKAKKYKYDSVAQYIISASLNKLDFSQEYNDLIYTLTLNPAIDYIISTDNKLEEITNFNPTDKIYEAGGKGINASIIMEQYATRNVALHYSGGFTGELIRAQLTEKGINDYQIKSQEDTRINLKLNFKDANHEINSTANPLTSTARNEFEKIVSQFNENEILMIMGSYHKDDEDFLFKISEISKKRNVELVYDLSKPVLKDLLKFNPLIVKPNKEELEDIFGIKVKNENDIINAMKELRALGAKNVAITLGKDGAYLLDEEDNLFNATVDPIHLVSPQGSGDSFISTFVVKRHLGSEEAFRWANAAGAATAQVKGLANLKLIEDTINKVHVKRV